MLDGRTLGFEVLYCVTSHEIPPPVDDPRVVSGCHEVAKDGTALGKAGLPLHRLDDGVRSKEVVLQRGLHKSVGQRHALDALDLDHVASREHEIVDGLNVTVLESVDVCGKDPRPVQSNRMPRRDDERTDLRHRLRPGLGSQFDGVEDCRGSVGRPHEVAPPQISNGKQYVVAGHSNAATAGNTAAATAVTGSRSSSNRRRSRRRRHSEEREGMNDVGKRRICVNFLRIEIEQNR